MNKIGSLIPSWSLGEDEHVKDNDLEFISHSNKEFKGVNTNLLAINMGC